MLSFFWTISAFLIPHFSFLQLLLLESWNPIFLCLSLLPLNFCPTIMIVNLSFETYVFFFILLPSLETNPRPYSSIPPALLLPLITFYLLFHTFAFLFKTYSAFPRLLHLLFRINHILLNVTTLYQSRDGDTLPTTRWRYFTNHKMMILYQSRDSDTLPITRRRYFTNHETAILYQSRDGDTLPITRRWYFTNHEMAILYRSRDGDTLPIMRWRHLTNHEMATPYQSWDGNTLPIVRWRCFTNREMAMLYQTSKAPWIHTIGCHCYWHTSILLYKCTRTRNLPGKSSRYNFNYKPLSLPPALPLYIYTCIYWSTSAANGHTISGPLTCYIISVFREGSVGNERSPVVPQEDCGIQEVRATAGKKRSIILISEQVRQLN